MACGRGSTYTCGPDVDFTMGAKPLSMYPINTRIRKILNSIMEREMAILIRFLRVITP
jgi:hypothetical protein